MLFLETVASSVFGQVSVVDPVVTNMLISGDTCLRQCPGEDTGQRGLTAPPSQVHIHISPIIIILGFLAGDECTLML